MPKLKTHKAAAARFHVTGSGKIMRTKGGKSHLRRHKPDWAKRLYAETMPVDRTDLPAVKRLIPYGAK